MSCAQCGQDNPEGARFCNRCGAALTATREERRLATILFADVVASTELAARLDPEMLRAHLARFYEIARGVVGEHGGTMEKFIGDAVMTVFGLPQAHDDDAERAVRAALAIRDAVLGDPELAETVGIRCGVNTGEVVGAVGTTGDFMVTGEPVNLAARLQQHADSGAVLVGERTARATEGRIGYEGPLELKVKGRAEPLRAWRAVGAAEIGLRPVRTSVPLLGRDEDVELLRALYRRTVTDRRAHVVTVVAPAGIGKSRLIGEIIAQLALRPDRPWIGRTQCLPYGTALAYGAMRGILRTLAGGDQARVEAFLAEHVADPEQRAALLVSAGLRRETAALTKEQVALAWREFTSWLALTAPLVLFIDDLHWASEGLLDLFEDLLRRPTDAPLFVVFAARPDLHERREGWPRVRRDATLIELRPLGEGDISKLVSTVGATLADTTRSRIVRRAEGNPYFAEEMVRVAVADRNGGGLPDSVQAAILTRLDQLPAYERRVTQAAAIVGRIFTAASVAAVDPRLTAEEVAGALRSLGERELVTPIDTDRHVFRHLLIRDVAVGTVPRVERADAHIRFSDWLGTQTADRENVELRAAHLEEALALRQQLEIPLDDALRARTIEALMATADRALQLYAARMARRHLERALGFVTDDVTRLRVLERLGDAIAQETPSETAVDRWKEAIEVWERIGADRLTGARLNRKIALLMARWPGAFRQVPQREDIETYARRVFDLAGDDAHERGLAHMALGYAVYTVSGVLSSRMADIRRAEELLRDYPDPDVRAALDDTIYVSLEVAGDYEAAYQAAKSAVERSATYRSLPERVEAYRNLSKGARLSGRDAEAAAAARRALELANQGDAGHWRFHAIQEATFAALQADDWERVIAHGDDLKRAWEQVGEEALVCNRGVCALLAEIHARRGSTEEAKTFDRQFDRGWSESARAHSYAVRRLRLGDRDEELARRLDSWKVDAGETWAPKGGHHDPHALVELMEAAAQLRDREKFTAFAGQLPEKPPLAVEAQRLRAAGRLALSEGDRSGAREELLKALEGFRAAGRRWEAATTAVLLAPLVDPSRAAELREEARAVFSRLGDRMSLAKLEEASPSTAQEASRS